MCAVLGAMLGLGRGKWQLQALDHFDVPDPRCGISLHLAVLPDGPHIPPPIIKLSDRLYLQALPEQSKYVDGSDNSSEPVYRQYLCTSHLQYILLY